MAIKVKDVMVKPLLTIDINQTAKNAGEILRRTRRDSLIVTKNGKPIGIITDTDLIKKLVAKNLLPSKIKIKKIMASPLVVIPADASILDASRKMKRNNIKRLAVVENKKLIGVVSLSDIARNSPEVIDLLEFKLHSKETPTEIKEKSTVGICEGCDNYSVDLQNVNGQWICESCREEIEV
jgi:prevent-host-death family protein